MRASSDPSTAPGRRFSKEVRSWCLYDWASSAFATTVMAAMFPPFFRARVTELGLSPATATAYWGYTTAAALALIALAAPLLGAMADQTGGKKRYLGAFALAGMAATAALPAIGFGDWKLASILYIVANIGFAGGNIFYESLLPHVARHGDIDSISTRGYAIGYIGGGILLTVNVLWVMRPSLFGLPGAEVAVKASFLSVALWWALFSIPFFRGVSEPPVVRAAVESPLRGALLRLRATFHHVRRFRQLLLFLIAFWLYNDGIGTIVKMATAFGDEIGIGLTDMVTALIITQFIGIPCTFVFGRLAGRMGVKRAILIALAVYACIAIGGYFMRTALHFYLLATAVGTVQGGAQALSRSLFGSMVPRHKSAEFFGFYNTSSRFAGIVGPLLFGAVSQATGQSRLSIAALVVFFVAGAALLSRVDVAAGIRAAREEESLPPAEDV